jgi:hypothetical protein
VNAHLMRSFRQQRNIIYPQFSYIDQLHFKLLSREPLYICKCFLHLLCADIWGFIEFASYRAGGRVSTEVLFSLPAEYGIF